MAAQDPLSGFLGESEPIRRVRELARNAARVSAPVLIEGETGTGKSHLARLIHESGARRAKAFVPVNCPGIPEPLFESEFFGYAEGAFTGAQKARPGLFQMADGGTLFLDEIADLPLAHQSKLLMALDDGEIRRVGARRSERVDARVISASSGALGKAVRVGRFRCDLLFRIALLRIRIPPLRERSQDVPVLARRLAAAAGRRYLSGPAELGAGAMEVLTDSEWPGNVRGLRFVLEAAVVLAQKRTLDAPAVREAIDQSAGALLEAGQPAPEPAG